MTKATQSTMPTRAVPKPGKLAQRSGGSGASEPKSSAGGGVHSASKAAHPSKTLVRAPATQNTLK